MQTDIIALILFLIVSIGLSLYYFNKKDIRHKKLSDKIKYWIIATLLIALSFVVVFTIYIAIVIKIESYYQDKEFTTKEWTDNPDKRFELIKNLMDSKKLNGKNNLEMISVLGQFNTNTAKNKDDIMVNGLYDNFPDTTNTNVDFVYYLGTKPGLLQSPLFLFIWFKNDTVSKYEIRGTYN